MTVRIDSDFYPECLTEDNFIAMKQRIGSLEDEVGRLNEAIEAERRATITACLDVIREESAFWQTMQAQSPERKDLYWERVAACERIATRLKQLEEQK